MSIFPGSTTGGNPLWSATYENSIPVFEDKNGVGWNTSVSYNKGLKKYLLITEHAASRKSNIGVFSSEEPWGPWATVYYGKFGNFWVIEQTTFFYNFSNKWLSDDGLGFVLIFTGIQENDSWNTVSGRFLLSDQKTE